MSWLPFNTSESQNWFDTLVHRAFGAADIVCQAHPEVSGFIDAGDVA
jgi:hypothetical protein